MRSDRRQSVRCRGSTSKKLSYKHPRTALPRNGQNCQLPKLKSIVFIRIWWYTYPPRSLSSSIRVKSLRAKRAVQNTRKAALAAIQRGKFDRTARDFFLALLAFMCSTQSSIARDCERELKAASRGTLGGLAMLH